MQVYGEDIQEFMGLAIADVLFGTFNPTGKISQTFYCNNYTMIETKENMNMRPNNNNGTGYGIGRGYRYYMNLGVECYILYLNVV